MPDMCPGAGGDLAGDFRRLQRVRHLHQDMSGGSARGRGMKCDVIVVGAGPGGSMAAKDGSRGRPECGPAGEAPGDRRSCSLR